MTKTFTIILLLIPIVLPSKGIDQFYYEPIVEATVQEKITRVLLDSGYSSRMAEIVVAQAAHESGNFTNPLTRRHNNIFGMRHPRVRPTTSLGPLANAEGRKGYASYNSIEDATRDYILYSRHFNLPDTTLNIYVTILHDKRYYECKKHQFGKGECSRKLYQKALKRWVSLNQNQGPS